MERASCEIAFSAAKAAVLGCRPRSTVKPPAGAAERCAVYVDLEHPSAVTSQAGKAVDDL